MRRAERTFRPGYAARLAALVAVVLVAGIAASTAESQTGEATRAPSTGAEFRDAIRDKRDDLQAARVNRCYRERDWRRYVSEIPWRSLPGNLRYVRNRLPIVRDKTDRCDDGLWQCVHEHEGAWDDPNAPYFGGLQMGLGFAGAYGTERNFGRHIYRQEGAPNRWAKREQIAVADLAYRRNGHSASWLDSQWPETTNECGRFVR